jgi:transcriptional regulator with XRE-family HTH domain
MTLAEQATTSLSMMRVKIGTALQKHRLRRGLTQAQLAELAKLSLKYVGEVERGEANTTLETLEKLADACGWNPMEALDGLREPISEGVRVLLLSEAQQMLECLKTMMKWLHALDPAMHPQAKMSITAMPTLPMEVVRKSRVRARSSRKRKPSKPGKS